jgi:release factor glutamine methyltransferase
MNGAGSVGAVMRAAVERLAAAGIDSARLDARVLMGFALGRDAGWLIGHRDDALSAADADRFEGLLARREARAPLAYITGEREFWSLSFRVTPATLIPRPETETLIETVLAAFPNRDAAFRILDLGTGSGCILLALLHERPRASGVGIDTSAAALDVAAANAEALGLSGRCEFRLGSWFSTLADREVFDAVVTNPPYVTSAEMEELPPEVAGHEPEGALAAGGDGLDAYRDILPGLTGRLRPGGFFAGEIGWRQGEAAVALARDHGLEGVEIRADGAGRARVLTASMAG